MIKFSETFSLKGINSIAFPLLGVSNGGISEEIALEIMLKYLDHLDLNIEIYRYDSKVADDVFHDTKEFILTYEKDIDYLSQETRVQKKYLEILVSALKSNSSLCQINQLIKLKGIGPITLEKIFAYKLSKLYIRAVKM